MEPLSTKTANNYRRVCNAYNALIVQGTDGKITIEKLDMILVCLRTLGEYPIIDLTTDTVFTPDQKETTFTGNLDIKNEPTPGGLFGNTTRKTAPRGLFGNTTHLRRPQARQWQPRIQLDPPRNKPVRGAIVRKHRNTPTHYEKACWTEQQLLPAQTPTRSGKTRPRQ
jgi:hypothetical protein